MKSGEPTSGVTDPGSRLTNVHTIHNYCVHVSISADDIANSKVIRSASSQRISADFKARLLLALTNLLIGRLSF